MVFDWGQPQGRGRRSGEETRKKIDRLKGEGQGKSPHVLISERNSLFQMTDLPASNQKDSELFMTVNALYNGSAAVCDFQTRNKTLFLIKQKKKEEKKNPVLVSQQSVRGLETSKLLYEFTFSSSLLITLKLSESLQLPFTILYCEKYRSVKI